ncbi:pseudouridine synthase [Ephemerocybe angulata]|uniref:21S rRNA pseudouridine(2819) synthase n=1 Tax=Ephemerocybe angulata TaxID=980116 RepID=A0A8H6M192_9AGAR|nr:pseudouridine synthase [Tulosesus angulatus]
MKNAIASHLKSVMYMDRGMLVLNKLPGLTCQLTGERHRKPLAHRASKEDNKFNLLVSGLQQQYDLPSPPLPVHRLDAGTTGCLTLAVTQRAAQEMSRQFAQGAVHKTYLALVRGNKKSFKGTSGRVEDPIEYEDGFFKGYGEDGQPSITEWEVLADSPVAPVTLVRLKLLTGNKHQLRIHLANSLHVPILGDQKYSRNPTSEAITSQAQIPPDRMFLHASHLSLFKYRSGGGHKRVRVGIHAPLPSDFVGVCHQLEIPLSSLDIEGGLFTEGEPVQGKELPDFQGRWLWSRNSIKRS